MPNYGWVAVYKNKQPYPCIQNGIEISADTIDRDKVETFIIYNRNTQQPVLTLHLDPLQRLIYRRRTEQTTNGVVTVCHMVGWRRTIGNECIQSIIYCFEDGRIDIAGKFKEDHPWFYEPVLRDFEK